MTPSEILKATAHRPWPLPTKNWSFYQEWNAAVFLHWQVELKTLKQFIPSALEIDVFEGKPWVSVVAFTMEKIRPRYLPYFPPISNFNEINIRTYVTYKGKPGVYFLSIEGGTKSSCKLSKLISELPYRFSKMKRTKHHYQSHNRTYNDSLNIRYSVKQKIKHKSKLELWLTERYALFQDTPSTINTFEIHHIEWPIHDIHLESMHLDYERFDALMPNDPLLAHYSKGVQILAWNKIKNKKTSSTL